MLRAQSVAPCPIGREVAIQRHLEDGEEFKTPLGELLRYGMRLFNANWTVQEGGGRPLMKGNGRPLSDLSNKLAGARAFNRFSAPDANACSGCHNSPFGIVGGRGDFVTNVFVQAQRFDFVTFDPKDTVPTGQARNEDLELVSMQTVGNMRASTGLFGAGYLEMLARQITADLQAIRNSIKPGESKALLVSGISFGSLSRSADGRWVGGKVQGLPRQSLVSSDPQNPPSLIIRPWHQSGSVISLREFSNTAFNQHHGMQSTERFGRDQDPDGDGVVNELTRADITAITLFQASLQAPGRLIPRDPAIERAVLKGEALFASIGCAACHVPSLSLRKADWKFSEPNPFNPAMNLRTGEAPPLAMDLTGEALPAPRLKPGSRDAQSIEVPAYTDFKLHDITSGPDDPNAESIDMNQSTWATQFKTGNQRFLTKRLWGVGNQAPYYHHGLFTTMREAIVAHSGEALSERKAFEALPPEDRDALIEFLKTLQVLPPGTRDLIVDERYRRRDWPPR